MPLFDSLLHTFGTVGTGGFGLKADSIASYTPYLQWVITIFMFICGINFNLYYLIFMRKFKSAIKSGELWAYVGIAVVATVIIAFNTHTEFANIGDTIRASSFQVSSIITSTGYSTVDYNVWPTLSKTVLVVLMFIGACAGSTGGGFKVARIVMLLKMIKQELRRVIHPKAVTSVKFEGKVLEKTTLSGVSTYLAIFVLFFVTTLLLISFEPFGFETNFTTVLSCINNIGAFFPGSNVGIGFGSYSAFSKIILSFVMLFGRLEIYPLLIALTPSTWTRN